MLLELEQSYKASARLISAVDEMLQALMAVVEVSR
jgi:flagellar hook-associated protein 1 FlgK